MAFVAFLVGFFFAGSRCIGGVFSATSTARSKRSQELWDTSKSSVFGFLFFNFWTPHMLEGYPPKPTRITPFLPPKHLQALGNIAAYYAYLESSTEITIWAFLDLDYHLGTAVTSGMGTISRIQLLTILADTHLVEMPEIHQHFIETLKLIDGVRVRRNEYIHALWKHERNKEASEIHALKRSAKGTVKTTTKGVTIKELRDLACEVEWLTEALQSFIEFVFPNFPVPWPRTHEPQADQKTD